MSELGGLVERAASRAVARRQRYGSAPGWSTSEVDLVAEAARDAPERLAVIDRRARLTFAELDRAVSIAAAHLRARGAGPGRSVLVVVQNDVSSVVAIHAALRAGSLVLVAPTSAGAAQIADIVEQTAADVRVAPDEAIASGAVPGVASAWVALGGLRESLGEVVPATPRAADEPAVVLFTSGTTSRPKGVIHSLSTLLATTANYVEQAEISGDDIIFVVSPLASITGILQCITTPCVARAPVAMETKWDPGATCELLVEVGGTFFGGPDLLLDRLLDEVEARGGSSTTLRVVYLGGAMLDPRVLARIEDGFGIVVLRAYGSSEAPVSTSGHVGESRDVRLADDGAPLRGVEVRRGSRNDPAECAISGPHLFLGYLDVSDDDHAFEVDDDGREWFCTGDVADLEAGRVKIVGRIRDIVIRKGMKVPISEVESYMNALPGVARTAGFSVADSETGERLAVAVLPEGGADVTLEQVVAGLRDAGLATWKLPEELVIWDEPFPENATGKVLRKRVEELSAGRPRRLATRLVDR